jgi:hypothetical protein
MFLFSSLTGSLGGRRVHDTTSGLRCLSRRAMTTVVGLSGGDLHSEAIIYSLLRGLTVVEVPVQMAERAGGESMYGAMASLTYPLKTLLSIGVLFLQARREGRITRA